MNLIIYVLLTFHFIADFHLQSDTLVENKHKSILYLLLHSGIYAFLFAVGSILCFACNTQNFRIFIALLIAVFVSHFLIDWSKIRIEKSAKSSNILLFLFLVDQGLHILIIMLSIEFLKYNSCVVRDLNTYRVLIKALFLFVTLTKPSSVLIKCIFSSLFPNQYLITENENFTETKDAGQFIGVLERIIISIFLLLNQYGAIGLVLTAKSIARFKQLEDKNFAEKYLIGTLLSFVIALILSIMVRNY